MKYLKKFNESEEGDFDLDFAMSKIKEKYTEEEVAEMFDNEISEWVDPNWEDEYESEYDWYVDHNNYEVQDVVIENIINWYKKEYKKDLSTDEYLELYDEIKSHYDLL
jgi:hypothetical protein